MKKLDGCISLNFKKIRINKKKVDKEVHLHSKLQELKEKDDKNSVKERTMILETIAKEAKCNFKKLKEGIGMLKPNNGGMN